ncbi:type II secretion system F family protein [Spirillospora sp. NBC_00431]
MTPLTVIAGVLVGLGVFLLISELRPAPPRLDAILDNLEGRGAQDSAGVPGTDPAGLKARLAARLAGPGGLPVPSKDLALLGKTPEQHVLTKVGCALLGLLLPGVPAFTAAISGMSVPVTIPVGAGLAMAVALFLAPDVAVRVDASKRRSEFRRVLITYLDLVALERAAGAAPNEALETAARVSGGWVFRRIAAVLERARRAQEPPWEGLARLGADVGVEEMADIADIARIAGDEGAKILETLTAKAEAMRGEQLADAVSGANANTTTMVIPISLLGFGFMLLLAFPVLYRMAGT